MSSLRVAVARLVARLDPFGRIPISDAQVRAWRPSLETFDGIALIFGYDPARRASRLDPMLALRAE